MGLYWFSLLLGSAGLAMMAVSGLGRHAHSGRAHGGRIGHHTGPRASHAHSLRTLLSPRVFFSVLIGLGATGALLQGTLRGVVLLGAALTGGVLFERLLVSPLWNFLFRFASTPATTLDHCIAEEAKAVSTFDADGHWLVAIELDGQIVQLLATLRETDREAGVRVRAGDRVLIEDVDTRRNRCIVSVLRG
jgi:translation initiation factor IF-1